MCACSHYGFLPFLNLCICCVCKWKMEVCWPVLTMKKKNVCSQLPICKCFGRVKMLSTQPWRLDRGHTDRLSQPAVSEPSRKDLSICFQPGRLCFSGQNLGLQMILANNLSQIVLFSLCRGRQERSGEGGTRDNTYLSVWLRNYMYFGRPNPGGNCQVFTQKCWNLPALEPCA